jgi:hypothetical protein
MYIHQSQLRNRKRIQPGVQRVFVIQRTRDGEYYVKPRNLTFYDPYWVNPAKPNQFIKFEDVHLDEIEALRDLRDRLRYRLATLQACLTVAEQQIETITERSVSYVLPRILP